MELDKQALDRWITREDDCDPAREEAIADLAQKLYNADGHAGDLYESDLDTVYEAKAIKIIDDNEATNACYDIR